MLNFIDRCFYYILYICSQVFREKLIDKPSDIFARLLKRNPSPYGFFVNLGRYEPFNIIYYFIII